MKKKILITLALAILLALAGCNSASVNDTNASDGSVQRDDQNTTKSNDSKSRASEGQSSDNIGGKDEGNGVEGGGRDGGASNQGDGTSNQDGESDEGTEDGSPGGKDSENSGSREDDKTGNGKVSIPVQGGKLPIDHVPIFERVRALVGAGNSPPPNEVIVRNSEFLSMGFSTVSGNLTTDFRDILLAGEGSDLEGGAVGLYVANSVYVALGDRGNQEVEKILAHEFFHSVQYDNRTVRNNYLRANLTPTEKLRVWQGLIEGGAVYVSDEYIRTYMRNSTGNASGDDGVSLQSERLAEDYNRSSSRGKYARAPYHFGNIYISKKIDSAKDIWDVYRNPPQTTEQLLHGVDESPASLSVVSKDLNSSWTRSKRDRYGELFMRIALGSADTVNSSYAAEGADGWGNERLLEYSKSESTQSGYVWLLRWDDSKNASEFVDVFRQYLNGRAEKEGVYWVDQGIFERWFTYSRPTSDTVAVLLGPKDFVNTVSVRGSGSDFSVRFMNLRKESFETFIGLLSKY